MGKISKIFGKLLKKDSEEFSRQDLSDRIFSVFEQSLRRRATREGLLFDTNYAVYLPEETYTLQQDSFAHTVSEVVTRCHRVLREVVKSYPYYKPHSHCWRFRFIKVTEDVDLGKNNERLQTDRIVIVPALQVEKRRPLAPPKKRDTTVKTVVTTRKNYEESGRERIDIEGLTVIDKDCFEMKLDCFEESEASAKGAEGGYIAHAVVKLKAANFTDDSEFYYMTGSSLYIVGMNCDTTALTAESEVAVIEDEKLPADFHLHIRYQKDSKFTISGSKGSLLNEDIRLEPETVKPLLDGSSIMIAGRMQINFSIIK